MHQFQYESHGLSLIFCSGYRKRNAENKKSKENGIKSISMARRCAWASGATLRRFTFASELERLCSVMPARLKSFYIRYHLLKNLHPNADETNLLPFSPLHEKLKLVQNTSSNQTLVDDPSSRKRHLRPFPKRQTAEGMPSALTSPVLDNVPTTLDKSQMDIPATKPATNAAQVSDAPSSKGTEEKSVNQATNEKRPGPALRQRFSVLFTEQRPFLLYAENASISYLMPNALVEHPWDKPYAARHTGKPGFGNLASLAQTAGQSRTARKANGRPQLTISGRVEDRFSSDTFSSLFLKETRKKAR